MIFSGYELGSEHVRVLAAAERAARHEDERREGQIEAARNRAMVLAPAVQEANELARRAVDLAAEREERAEEQKRQERAEQAANLRASLAMVGQLPHTVQDVLEAARLWA